MKYSKIYIFIRYIIFSMIFTNLAPLGRVGLVVAMSVCMHVSCPLPMLFFPRLLIGTQITLVKPPPSIFFVLFLNFFCDAAGVFNQYRCFCLHRSREFVSPGIFFVWECQLLFSCYCLKVSSWIKAVSSVKQNCRSFYTADARWHF